MLSMSRQVIYSRSLFDRESRPSERGRLTRVLVHRDQINILSGILQTFAENNFIISCLCFLIVLMISIGIHFHPSGLSVKSQGAMRSSASDESQARPQSHSQIDQSIGDRAGVRIGVNMETRGLAERSDWRWMKKALSSPPSKPLQSINFAQNS